MTQHINKFKRWSFNASTAIALGLMIAALFVVDQVIATRVLAIACGILVFRFVFDKSFRRMF